MASELLRGPESMQAAAVQRSQRRSWDAPARSQAQERFYRSLMSTQDLPSPPEVAQRMLVTVNREEVSVEDLAKLIARDQSLTVALLRLANSAFFALRTKVTSIPQAVTLLGFTRVRSLVLGLSVWASLEGKDPGAKRQRQRLWAHTAAVAALAKLLVDRTGGDAAAAFAAGLLHDVGKLILGVRLGESYWSLLDEAAGSGERAATVEEATFGCHHGTVGGWLLQIWQLPPSLVDPVALHHEPLVTAFGMDVTAAVSVANRLIDATDPGSGAVREEVLAEVRSFAPGLLGTDDWRDLYAAVVREQQAVAGLFG